MHVVCSVVAVCVGFIYFLLFRHKSYIYTAQRYTLCITLTWDTQLLSLVHVEGEAYDCAALSGFGPLQWWWGFSSSSTLGMMMTGSENLVLSTSRRQHMIRTTEEGKDKKTNMMKHL